MPNEPNSTPDPTPPTETTPTETPATPPAERTFTQADVDRIAADARRQGRESALNQSRQTETKPATTTSGDKSSPVSKAELQAQIDAIRMERDFERAARKFSLSDAAVDTLQELALAVRPEDLPSWLDTKVKALGLSQTTPSETPAPPSQTQKPSQQTQQTQAPQTQQRQTPPASDRGGPAPTSDGLLADNALKWTEAERDRRIAEADSHSKGVKSVKEAFMKSLRGVTLVPPR